MAKARRLAPGPRRQQRRSPCRARALRPPPVHGRGRPGNNSGTEADKEDDTVDRVYVNSAGPNDKTDFKHIMAHARIVGNSAFAYLGAEHISKTTGQWCRLRVEQEVVKQFLVGPAKPNRSVGDLLISLEYSNARRPIVTCIRSARSQPSQKVSDQVNFDKVSDAATIDAVRSATISSSLRRRASATP